MESQHNDIESLSRIREILFGAQIEGLENQLLLVKEEITQTIRLIDEEHQKKYNLLHKLLEERTETNKQKILQLQENLEGLKDSMSRGLSEIENALNTSVNKLETQIKDTEARFQLLIDQNLELINQNKQRHEIMENKISTIENTKLGKEILARWLTDFARELSINDPGKHD
ncbi:MAG: hypothetical protein CVT99_04945 [Bacteroidetes bacterium HGW-Bacteroidetes-16]|jgi:uncharacterized membrane-anchored protein YhcB (DUF1043 family)|nr:MAG: hypothetical protein CVT99_04945 [Bacteroidetes bacterium HGW-Bacteroidetes-16]